MDLGRLRHQAGGSRAATAPLGKAEKPGWGRQEQDKGPSSECLHRTVGTQNTKASKETWPLGERSLCSQPRARIQGTQISLPRAILSSPCCRGHLHQSLLEFLQTPQAARYTFHCISYQPRPALQNLGLPGVAQPASPATLAAPLKMFLCPSLPHTLPFSRPGAVTTGSVSAVTPPGAKLVCSERGAAQLVVTKPGSGT